MRLRRRLPPPEDPSHLRINGLEGRVADLEEMLQGLQDAVHRDAVRRDEQAARLERRIEPANWRARSVTTHASAGCRNAPQRPDGGRIDSSERGHRGRAHRQVGRAGGRHHRCRRDGDRRRRGAPGPRAGLAKRGVARLRARIRRDRESAQALPGVEHGLRRPAPEQPARDGGAHRGAATLGA